MKITDKHNPIISAIEMTERGIDIYYKNGRPAEFLSYTFIKSIEIYITTESRTHRSGTYTVTNNVQYTIKAESNDIVLNSGSDLKPVYEIIRYRKYYGDLKITVKGPKDGIEIPLKIYSKFGIRLPIKQNESAFEIAALLFLALCFYIGFLEYDVNNSLNGLLNPYEIWLQVLVPIILLSSVFSGIVLYQEYIKLKIRKLIGTQEAIEQYEENPTARNCWAVAREYLLAGNSEQARIYAKKILETEPENKLVQDVLNDKDLGMNPNILDSIYEGYDDYSEKVIIGEGEGSLNSVINYLRERHWLGIIVFVIDIVILLAILCTTVLPSIIFQNNDYLVQNMRVQPENSQRIEFNQLTDYDGYSKTDIYNLRKKYVNRSMFKSDNYEPNEDVFGRLQDGKYWLGTENLRCRAIPNDAAHISTGDSYVSRLINNPAFLVGVDLSMGWNTPEPEKYRVCSDKKMLLIPNSISYSRDLNMITAVIPVNKIVIGVESPYILNGLNARDLGFKYGYVFNKENIEFANKTSSIDKELYTFKDYLSVGGSCGIEGGCNNIFQRHNNLMFYFGDEYRLRLDSTRAIIDFKLWKEKPVSVLSKPDMYYRLIFEKR